MNRVLIAASDLVTAEGVQTALAANGFQTAVVTNCGHLVEFCRQHVPDVIVVDLALPGGSVWSAAQALRCDARLSRVPMVGLGTNVSDQERQHARHLGIVSIETKPVSSAVLIPAVHAALQLAVQAAAPASNITPMPAQEAAGSAPSAASAAATGNDPVSRLLAFTREIRALTSELKPGVDQYGEEGPELFVYIENSGNQIWEELSRIATNGPEHSTRALQDKDLRHDFRNMIGSVTGFSELLLMEPTVVGPTRAKFTRIREICRSFCDVLDEQKAAAA